jgi:hypothetical protein|tara:strand:- start:4002 stop:4913 length:912 start_codon:yes stop_codon:yes gene_type:complete
MKFWKEYMNRITNFIIILFLALQSNAQEIRATISINSDKVPGSNRQVFETMQRSLSEFVNQKQWTNKKFKQQELIDCSFLLTILEQPSNNQFKGTLQIQSSRPIYGSTYSSPVLNFKDNEVAFSYTEFENFQYNPNSFDSNLVSVFAYYVYMILGLDADTFSTNGGGQYYSSAENTVNQAQQSGFVGWDSAGNKVNRFTLVSDILSGTYDVYRDVLYSYHMQGLDIMTLDKAKAKRNLEKSIRSLKSIYDRRPNALLLRIFMDAKSDEIVAVFSDGPRFDASQLTEYLSRISPINLSKWNTIK